MRRAFFVRPAGQAALHAFEKFRHGSQNAGGRQAERELELLPQQLAGSGPL